jgi:serine/threonine-protein kinase
MPTPDRLQRLEAIFHEVLDCPSPGRDALLTARCGDDRELRREIEALLLADASVDDDLGGITGKVASQWTEESQQRSLVGRDVDAYRILSLIGAGGMGEVYLAEERELGRRVAIKVLPPEFTRDARRLRRFTDEANAASALNHPNIITVFRVGEMGDLGGRRYIVTEFIDGETVRERLTAGALPAAEALAIAKQVASALAAAHAAGIVHRDIKPENVMVRRDGYVKVLDFGLAKLTARSDSGVTPVVPAATQLTREGAVVGTLHYMAPEQAMAGPVDARADLYSLAVVLFEMLTGRVPADPSSAVREFSASDPHQPASGALRAILRRGLALDPVARYQSAAEFGRDLDAAARGKTPRRAMRARMAVAGVAMTVILALGVAAGYRWLVAPAGPRKVTSLVVMPLDAFGATDQSHLELGLSEAIITRLAAVHELHVPPASAVRANEDPFAAARRLGVDAVLTGSVQRAADRLRVTAQLSRTKDRTQVWAGHFDERFTDIFSLQDAIAERIAVSLVPSLSPQEAAAIRQREARNSDAYDLYLRARTQWSRRTPESVRASIEMYKNVIALEPTFPLAYAGLADAYAISASGLPPKIRFPLAKEAALTAIGLDADLAQAHTALAFLSYKFEWNWAKAEEEFQRAVALDPRDALARHWHGEFLGLRGDFDRAVAEMRQAAALDPYSPAIRADHAMVLIKAGRLDEAQRVIDEGLQLDADEWRMYWAQTFLHVAAGRPDAAVESDLRARTLARDPADEIDALRAAAKRGGRPMFLRQLIARVKTRMAQAPVVPYGLTSTLASAYAELNDRADTLEWLNTAADRGEDGPLMAKTLPVYRFLHGDPAFNALLKRVGLPPFFTAI